MTAKMIAGAQRVGEREKPGGDAGQRPAHHGQEVEERHPQAPQQGVGDTQGHERHEDDDPGDDRGDEVAEHEAGDGPVDLARDPRHTAAAFSGAKNCNTPFLSLGPSSRSSKHEDEHHEEIEPEGEGTGPELQGGLGEILGVALQLGQVLLDPVLHVVLAHQMADVPRAFLGAAHVVGQLRDEVAQAVGEGGTEGIGEPAEHEQREHGDDGDGVPPPLTPPPAATGRRAG